MLATVFIDLGGAVAVAGCVTRRWACRSLKSPWGMAVTNCGGDNGVEDAATACRREDAAWPRWWISAETPTDSIVVGARQRGRANLAVRDAGGREGEAEQPAVGVDRAAVRNGEQRNDQQAGLGWVGLVPVFSPCLQMCIFTSLPSRRAGNKAHGPAAP
ncbi:hypothetical protein PMIN06_009224 [Paraphaeosphaeria minitans]